MKQIYSILLLMCVVTCSFAQLTITDKRTALQLANTLVATSGTSGVTISNPVLTCDSLANGLLSGNSNIGITNGIALSTGRVASNTSIFAWGLDGLPGEMGSSYLNTAGDATLNAIITATTYDACVLEFDIVPVGNFVEFEYVFGSEEYPEFNCTSFNDVFGFFISGPGITGVANMALIPSTTIPVSINSINDGTGLCTPPANTLLYVTNTDTFTTMDGFTTPLIATHTVTGGQNYHLKLAIADAADGVLNSYVIIKANSLKSSPSAPSGVSTFHKNIYGVALQSNCTHDYVTITNATNELLFYKVIDLNGRIVYQINSNSSKIEIPVSSFSKGLHTLMYSRSNGKIYAKKFIVE